MHFPPPATPLPVFPAPELHLARPGSAALHPDSNPRERGRKRCQHKICQKRDKQIKRDMQEPDWLKRPPQFDPEESHLIGRGLLI